MQIEGQNGRRERTRQGRSYLIAGSSRWYETDSGGRLAQRPTYYEAVKAAIQRRNGEKKKVFDLAFIGREGVWEVCHNHTVAYRR